MVKAAIIFQTLLLRAITDVIKKVRQSSKSLLSEALWKKETKFATHVENENDPQWWIFTWLALDFGSNNKYYSLDYIGWIST